MTTPSQPADTPDVKAIQELVDYRVCDLRLLKATQKLLAYVERLEASLARVTADNERLTKEIDLKHVRFGRTEQLECERDEAVGLLRIVADMTLSHSSLYHARVEISEYLSRLDQPQSPEQEKP